MYYSWILVLSFFYLILTTMISLNANSWFIMWISLEMNMMMFIPLCFSFNKSSTSSLMKYLIIQSFASSMFLASILMNNYFLTLILISSMILKLGAMPLHFWYPKMSFNLNWMSFWILSTIQKFIPLYILSFLKNNFIMMFIILSCVFTPFFLFNCSSLLLLMSYSSISHLSWMFSLMLVNKSFWFIYLLIYSFILLNISSFLEKKKSFSIFSMWNFSSMNNFKMMIYIMSLSGLPPLLGFFPKWFSIFELYNSYFLIMILLILNSLISIFIYMKIIYPFLFLNKKKSINKNNKNSYIWMFMNSFGLILLIPFI